MFDDFDDRSFRLQLLRLFFARKRRRHVPSSALGRAEESEKSCFELQWNCAPWWCQLHMLEACRIQGICWSAKDFFGGVAPWKFSRIFTGKAELITNKLDQPKAGPNQQDQCLCMSQPAFCCHDPWSTISLSGWWLGHPSEKYERQLGWLATQYMGK